MDAREQTLNLLGRIWVKLQGLPNANPIELGAFFVLLTFIREFFVDMFFFPPHCLFINKLVMTLFICCSPSCSPAHHSGDLRELLLRLLQLLLSQEEAKGFRPLSKNRHNCKLSTQRVLIVF